MGPLPISGTHTIPILQGILMGVVWVAGGPTVGGPWNFRLKVRGQTYDVRAAAMLLLPCSPLRLHQLTGDQFTLVV